MNWFWCLTPKQDSGQRTSTFPTNPNILGLEESTWRCLKEKDLVLASTFVYFFKNSECLSFYIFRQLYSQFFWPPSLLGGRFSPNIGWRTWLRTLNYTSGQDSVDKFRVHRSCCQYRPEAFFRECFDRSYDILGCSSQLPWPVWFWFHPELTTDLSQY